MAPWKTYSKVLQGDGKSFSKGIWNMRHVSCFCTNLCFPITPGAWHTPVLCRVWYVKTPSLAINTDRSLLCFWWHGMARHVLSFLWLHLDWCISMSLSQPWLFFFFRRSSSGSWISVYSRNPREYSACHSSWYQRALQLVQLENLYPHPQLRDNYSN